MCDSEPGSLSFLSIPNNRVASAFEVCFT